MKQTFYTFFILFFCLFDVFAQSPDLRNFPETVPPVPVPFITEKILPDGILSEAVWAKAKPFTNFAQKFPTDTLAAKGETVIYMAYDAQNLYVATKCYSKGSDWIVPSLRRDFGFIGNDNITLMFDTFNDKTNAFVFGMNAEGVRREALIANGGRSFSDFSDGWDNKWFGDAKMFDDHWIAEFVIPLNTLRFREGETKWRFNAYRYDTQHNEISLYVHIPINLVLTDLNFMGEMQFERPLEKSGANISVIPYTSAAVTHDFEDTEQPDALANFGVGGDVKIGITSGLNLDLTVNPDFSQVEVDRQVTNLNRFEIFFPERRQFFLENADLFSDFSTGRSRPFFSRRIGIAQDTATGDVIQNTILYGARLTGKLNDRTRIGLLNMQTAAQPDNDLPSFNYTVGVVQRNIGARSNISFLGINKQAINSQDFSGSFNNYNRVYGFDYNLATVDNKWAGKFSHQQAITVDDTPQKFSNHFILERRERTWRAELFSAYVGAGYDAEVGFVPRRDIYFLSPEVEFFVYPEGKSITRHSLEIDTRFIYKIGQEPDPDFVTDPWTLSDGGASLRYGMQFRNFANFNANLSFDEVLLFNDFDPTRIQEDDVFLPAGVRYRYWTLNNSFRSDRRKEFSYRINTNVGNFFGGTRLGLRVNAEMRFQPYGSVALDVNYNYIDLKGDFIPANLFLIGPRVDLTFSKKLFFTTFVQFNNQAENLNINARLQWRFAPVSDFFLVYTDNYFTPDSGDFSNIYVRNRALVAKLTYWLNI